MPAGQKLQVTAGENIKIEYGAGEATISAKDTGLTSGDFTQITVVTAVQLTSGGTLQKKTRTALVYTPGVETGWVDAGALSTTTCPSGA